MMKRTFALCITAAAFLACGLSGWAGSRLRADQKPSRAPRPTFKGDVVAVPKKPVEVKQPGHLGTIVHGVEDLNPDLGGAITRAFQQAPMPPSRRLAFARFDQPNYRVDGWSVRVQDIENVPGARLVKVEVAPLLSANSGSITVIGGVIEWYRFDGKGLHLLKTDPPNGEPAQVTLFVD